MNYLVCFLTQFCLDVNPILLFSPLLTSKEGIDNVKLIELSSVITLSDVIFLLNFKVLAIDGTATEEI
jgi:hypothetical protein